MPADMHAAAARIAHQARRWRWERRASWTVATAMVALGAWLLSGNVAITITAAVLPLLAALWTERTRPITALTVARHLDRTVPALEESSTLLLDPLEHGEVLERMQRRRIASAFADVGALPRLAAPSTRMAVLGGGVCL